jgi:hypothetical protein
VGARLWSSDPIECWMVCQAVIQKRWRKVEVLYQSAMNQEPGLRFAYLDQACQGNAHLRWDGFLLALLALNDAPALVDRPAWQATRMKDSLH